MLNVSFEFPLCQDIGKLSDTYGIGKNKNILLLFCYHDTNVTSRGTGLKETKTYPTIHICLSIKLTEDYLRWNALNSTT